MATDDEDACEIDYLCRFYVLNRDTRQVERVIDDGSGVPLVVQWALQLTDEMRRVAYDVAGLAHPVEISTVFLGTNWDLSFVEAQRLRRTDVMPRLFETAVFAGGTRHVIDRWQCRTLDAAERLHARALRQAQAGHYDHEVQAYENNDDND